MRPIRHARGFTVIEMLVVIAIIAILAGLLLATITAVQNRTKARLAAEDLKGLYLALERYKEKFGKYPDASTPASGTKYLIAGDGNGQGVTLRFIKLLRKHNFFSCEASQTPGNNDANLFLDPWGKGYMVEFCTGTEVPGSLPSISHQRSGIYIYSSAGAERKTSNKSKNFVYVKDD